MAVVDLQSFERPVEYGEIRSVIGEVFPQEDAPMRTTYRTASPD
jgi:hypothetical protein